MEKDLEKEIKADQNIGKDSFFSKPVYLEHSCLNGKKVDWSIMGMDQEYIEDIKDALKTDIENVEKRIKNACSVAFDADSDPRVLKKLSEKKSRIQLLIKLIENELD